MAKRKLSNLASQFIVECRDNPSETYTWDEISTLLNEKFGVSVKASSVYKAYHRYKEKMQAVTTISVEPLSQTFQSQQVASDTKPIVEENQPKPQIDPATLILGTGIREVEAEPEPLSSNTNIDPVVGDSEKNQPKPRLSNNRKFGIGDTPFKHNEVPSPELLKLFGIENT